MPVVNIVTVETEEPVTLTVTEETATEWALQLGDPNGVLQHTKRGRITYIPVRQITYMSVTEDQ